MEHEVFVPVPVLSLRRTLGDAARVARCVPGLQQDADASAGPLSGRLKIRVGGHTITYRGVLKLAGRDGDTFAVAGEGTEARGAGSAHVALTLTLTETDGGTTIEYAGTAGGEGRVAGLDHSVALAAAHRLLDRFTQQLVTESLAAAPGEASAGSVGVVPAEPAGDVPADSREEAVADGADEEDAADRTEAAVELDPAADEVAVEEAEADAVAAGEAVDDEESCDGPAPGDAKGSVYDAPVPPPSLDPLAEVEFTVPDGPPAEAAHARRTMIGRSTEEVDHAPPRGRYAPVPSPDADGAATTLRWIAPAAALALASAVVVGRALRRRR
ncbi:SRPBCC domain-containing protein [Streptomyces sp. NPDC048560]|uniref:SRPBCC domain-containing protein n=1 Tax=Streptomyces sp. NPDC048560 TaxID=3155488 RepID=UPI003427E278